MTKQHRQPAPPSGTRDLASGAYGMGRGNSASSALKIAGSQGSGGMPKGSARRMDHLGNMAPKGGVTGHCVGARPKGK